MGRGGGQAQSKYQRHSVRGYFEVERFGDGWNRSFAHETLSVARRPGEQG